MKEKIIRVLLYSSAFCVDWTLILFYSIIDKEGSPCGKVQTWARQVRLAARNTDIGKE